MRPGEHGTATFGNPTSDDLEGRVITQYVMIIAIFITAENAKQPRRQQPGIGTDLLWSLLNNHRQLWNKIKQKQTRTLRQHDGFRALGLNVHLQK